MATSGSVDFTLNRDEAIRSAFELIGVAVENETLQTEDIDIAARALNTMIKAWQAFGLQLWKRDTVTVTLVAGQAVYTMGATGDKVTDRPLRILEADRVSTDGTTTSLTSLTLNGYEALPNKAASGVPTQYFFNPTLDNSTISIWTVPDAAIAAEYTLSLIVQSPLEDMDATANNFDFPSEWLEAIVYNLAVRLAARYGGLDQAALSYLRRDAADILDLAKSFDTEDGSIFFQPDYKGSK